MSFNYEKPSITFFEFETEGVMIDVSNPNATIIPTPPGTAFGEDELG